MSKINNKKDNKVKKKKTITEKLWDFAKPYTKKGWRSIFPKRSKKENIIQYGLRQLLICDSSGNPSWTVTILFFIMIVVGFVVAYEINIAVSHEITYDAKTGKIVSDKLKGFSSEFIYLVIVLSAVITGFFQSREKRIFGNGNGNGQPTGIIDKAVDTLNKIKSKK